MADNVEFLRAALYGVAIFEPTASHPCLCCVEELAGEIEEALAGDPEFTLLPRKDTDWGAIARTGRARLCAIHLQALRVAIANQSVTERSRPAGAGDQNPTAVGAASRGSMEEAVVEAAAAHVEECCGHCGYESRETLLDTLSAWRAARTSRPGGDA